MRARLAAMLFAILAAATLGSADFASANNGNHYGKNGNNGNHYGNNKSVSGAPGPIAGAGLPMLAVGFGVYWLIRRRRKGD
jgi:hypothetical protein